MTNQDQINSSRILRASRRQGDRQESWLVGSFNLSANIITLLTYLNFLSESVSAIEISAAGTSHNSSSLNSTENNSPIFPDTTKTSWVIGIIMLPLVFTIIWEIYRRCHNRPTQYQELQENELPAIIITSAENTEYITTSSNMITKKPAINLSQVKISTEEAKMITQKIISDSQINDLLPKELKIFYVMALVWDKESESFCQLQNDKATYRSITRKTGLFIANQLSIYGDFTIFDDSGEAIELYLTVSQAIKEQQQQAPLAVKIISNFFSMLYIGGCMFSVFSAIYNNSHDWLLERPWLIMPIAESMIFANGVANHLFCTNRTQILLTHMLEKIFTKAEPNQLAQNPSENNSRSYKNIIFLATAIIAASAFGFFASITNASLPFIAGSTLPETWRTKYGGFTQEKAINASKYLGNIFAAGTLVPITLLYGSDAYKLGGKIYNGLIQTYQNGIKITSQKARDDFYRDPYLYLSHSILATIGTVRTIKFYQVINNRSLRIFKANNWPLEIVNEFTLLAVLATIPLTFDSMITTSNRLYNYFTTRDEGIKYSPAQQLMLAIAILNAVANSFLAMSGVDNTKTFGELFWESFSNLAAGVTSFAICTKFIGQLLSLKDIKEIKAWVKRNEEPNIESGRLAESLKKRLDASRNFFSPTFKSNSPSPNTEQPSLIDLTKLVTTK
jgi:hypothetical protein